MPLPPKPALRHEIRSSSGRQAFSRWQHSITDFCLASQQLGTLNIGFSAAASWLTAGAMLVVIGFFMLTGMGSIWGR